MAFTARNDINILSSADAAIVGAGVGDDLYIISPGNLPSSTQTITISDSNGANKIQLIGGLTIASAKAAATALQLVLSNGATINVNSADSFAFEIGGNPLQGKPGAVKTFAQFVTESLGLPSVPTGTDVLDAPNNIKINDNGTTEVPDAGIPLPVGSTVAITAAADAEVFTFNVAAALALTANTQIEVSGFDVAADSLVIDTATASSAVTTLADLDGVDGITVFQNFITNEILVNFGPDANGDPVAITLVGMIDPALIDVSVI